MVIFWKLCKRVKFEWMVYAQTRIYPKKWDFFESLVWLDLGLNCGLPDHWQTLFSLGQWPEQHERTCHLVDFLGPANHRVKRKIIKESKKQNKYLKLTRELKKLWMMMWIVVRIFGTVTKFGKRNWRNWRIEELRPPRLQHC